MWIKLTVGQDKIVAVNLNNVVFIKPRGSGGADVTVLPIRPTSAGAEILRVQESVEEILLKISRVENVA